MNYTHFTLNERCKIEKLINEGQKINEIARRMVRNKSSISREIKRNSIKGVYDSKIAESRYNENRKQCHRKEKWNLWLLDFANKHLMKKWSPEQMIGRWELENRKRFMVCLTTMYRYLKRHKKVLMIGGLRNCETCKKHDYGKIRYKGSLYVGDLGRDSKEFGHFEADLIVGKNNASQMLVITERLTNMTFACKLKDKTSKTTSDEIIRIFKENNLMKKAKSIVFDCGSEFSDWAKIENELKIKTAFAKPGRPYEKGVVEQINKLLRQWFKKKKDLSKYSDEIVDASVYLLNIRPRKKLGYRTPKEVFDELL